MPKALIHCFSGTGNTRLAAEMLSEELSSAGFDASTRNMEDGLYKGGEASDLHVFLFPVYATALPHIVARYLRRLPDGRGACAAVLCTNGRISVRVRDGYQGWALHQARLLLGLRHWDAFYSDAFDMPHNVTAFGPPREDVYNRKIMRAALGKVEEAAGRIAAGERRHRGIFFLNFLWCVPFGLLFSLAGRRMLGKLLSADPACTACGRCAKACPAKNIKMAFKRPRFLWRCEGCLRCLNACPKQSIQVPAARLLAAAVAAWNPLAAYGPALPQSFSIALGAFWGAVVNAALDLAVMLAVFCILDWVLFCLAPMPLLRHGLGWGHTSLYGRYRARRPD